MANLRKALIAALLASVASASYATSVQAENRHGTMSSRMMIKKHALGHRPRTSHGMR